MTLKQTEQKYQILI